VSDRITNEEVAKYRNVFMAGDGPEVLADLLTELGFFKARLYSPEEVALVDFSKLLLAKLGIWHQKNARSLVEAMIALPGFEQEEPSDADDQ
jgi:hypothetical protein